MGPSTRSAAKVAQRNITKSALQNKAKGRVIADSNNKVTKQQSKPRASKRSEKITDTATAKATPDPNDSNLASKKWTSWSAHSSTSPFPDFTHPSPAECTAAHTVLQTHHAAAVAQEFSDPDTPETIANVLDAMIIAVLSQATSWTNAKRAMAGLRETYGSLFAYDDILFRGEEVLQQALRPGGLHIRKAKIIFSILNQVQQTNNKSWDLNFITALPNEQAMEKLLQYKYIGSKSAFVVLGWCMKRNTFTVDTHCYRIAKLWGWTPKDASVEKTQQHLDAVIPVEFKFDLHFLMIQHGRTCAVCRGGSKVGGQCGVQREMKEFLKNGYE
ncbi:DNA glycosylase [Aureobasidium sp. EXF-3400]|nr:DNA glycosylase [Aureobasidium sp. EXF-12344]KAI4770264.1 DNA glycosylase [Aureobasidium sp. EXF-3400]